MPLSELALSQLEDIPRFGDHVFSSGRKGDAPVNGMSKAKERLDNIIGDKIVEPWTWHDIRRTVATGLAGLGIEPVVIEACLNHASGVRSGVAGVYNRHEYLHEKREAFGVWEKYLDDIAS